MLQRIGKRRESLSSTLLSWRSNLLLIITILIIITLITFVVPFAIQNMFSGSGGSDPVMRWSYPGLGEQELSYSDFTQEKRRLKDALDVLQGLTGRRSNVEDEVTASFIIYDAVAQAEGVEISEESFKDELRQLATQLGGVPAYKQRVRDVHTSTLAFETTLRRILRGHRYQNMIAAVAGQPDPAEIERLYKDQHQEYTVEYVELEELLASSRVISLHCPLTAEAREEEPSCFAPRISERSLRTGRDATPDQQAHHQPAQARRDDHQHLARWPPRHRRRRGGARLAKDRCASPRQLELESRGRLARLLRER